MTPYKKKKQMEMPDQSAVTARDACGRMLMKVTPNKPRFDDGRVDGYVHVVRQSINSHMWSSATLIEILHY